MMYIEIFLIGLLAALSPGPDFFIVMKNSLSKGRKYGVVTAIGVASALIVHVTYTILGFTFILEKWPSVFRVIKFAGVLYLLWLGWNAIQSKPQSNKSTLENDKGQIGSSSIWKGFMEGFLCNVLNPKSALFFLSIFSQFIGNNTPGWVRWIYGGEVILAVGLWFVSIAGLISKEFFRNMYHRYMHLFDRGLGIILIIFAIIIGVTTF
ncbi:MULTISPECIES: LysE family translocator [Bacillus amyloliquefaciens group]|uniref:LysE family translocator n=1 Tax=Bacillus amyloliquefaciens group TaxID=1938374 RepID=UPI000A5C5A30|nr:MULTISPECIES: LysE family transporter [Bacillus amyloliquefaciens group]MEA1006584.1 LysE family transporter [Bacillus velezensis]RCX30935.1 RhtB (resistance to homoserine/threonine) family protein [Bacillus amyloliquefaciens]